MGKGLLLILLSLGLLAMGSEIKGEVSLAVTVYNNQFAVVKDVRSIAFDKGNSDLYFTDVAEGIQTETVAFKALDSPESVRVYEQNFQANLISTPALLKQYLEKEIEIFAKIGETGERIEGTLLGYTSGVVLRTPKGIEVFNEIEGARFPSLPSGFFTLPTLNWKVHSAEALTTDCEVAYRTSGFSWRADYSLTLNGDESGGDFGGWVSIDNRSGKRYKNARLKLIAGEVNVKTNANMGNSTLPTMVLAKTYGGSSPSFSEKSFSDYHLYTLSEPVTLEENSQKQIEFVPKAYGVSVRKYHLLSLTAGGRTQKNLKAGNRIEIANTEANKMGMPLPKGTVRVFKEDTADGSLEFIGEDSINHTPKDENFTLTTGNAFDIAANKLASNYLSSSTGGFSADLNLTVWNHKAITAEVVVEINNFYGDNNQFVWKTPVFNFERVSASLLRISRKFAANEKFSYLWS